MVHGSLLDPLCIAANLSTAANLHVPTAANLSIAVNSTYHY